MTSDWPGKRSGPNLDHGSEALDRVRIPAGLGNSTGRHKYHRLGNRKIAANEKAKGDESSRPSDKISSSFVFLSVRDYVDSGLRMMGVETEVI